MRTITIAANSLAAVLALSSAAAGQESWHQPPKVEYKPLESIIEFTRTAYGRDTITHLDSTSANSMVVIGPDAHQFAIATPVAAPSADTRTAPVPVPKPAFEEQADLPTRVLAAANDKTVPEAVVGKHIGTDGNDTFDFGARNDTIEESGGNDTITSTISRSLEDFPFVAHLTLLGSDDIDGIGNVKANRITGNDGNNVLSGKGGADTLIGGKWDDTYVLEAATNDTIVELPEEGIDTIESTITRDLMDYENVENVRLTFSAHVDAYGDDGRNALTGNEGRNTLDGRGGDDVLDGGKGADTLIGGAGRDRFVLTVAEHTGTAAGHRDLVTDFVHGEDLIDWSAIADRQGEDLIFVDEAEFSGTMNEVRWFKKNKDWLILEADVDGDAVADFQIEVAPVRKILAEDLVLSMDR